MALQPFTAAFDHLTEMGCKAYLHQMTWTALKRLPALTDSQAALTDSQAVLTDPQAVLTDSQAGLTDSQAGLTDSQAALTDPPTVPGQTGKEGCTLTDH